MTRPRRIIHRIRRSTAARAVVRTVRTATAALPVSGQWADGDKPPLRFRWVRAAAIGPVTRPARALVAHDLRRSGSLDLVLVAGVSTGGPGRLIEVADELIICERRSTPTVLVAAATRDLDTQVAEICRYVATDDPLVADDAQARFGEARTIRVRDPELWLEHLARLARI